MTTDGDRPAEHLVRGEAAGGVATITLDSPRNRNALSVRLLGELADRLAWALAEESVRVIVLTGTGPVFCAGADLKEQRIGPDDTRGAPVTASFPEIMNLIWESPKPVVCRLNGTARAGGWAWWRPATSRSHRTRRRSRSPRCGSVWSRR